LEPGGGSDANRNAIIGTIDPVGPGGGSDAAPQPKGDGMGPPDVVNLPALIGLKNARQLKPTIGKAENLPTVAAKFERFCRDTPVMGHDNH